MREKMSSNPKIYDTEYKRFLITCVTRKNQKKVKKLKKSSYFVPRRQSWFLGLFKPYHALKMCNF